MFKKSTDGGANFGATINLSNNGGFSANPVVATSGNNVYVVWEDDTPGNSEIFLQNLQMVDTFGPTINLSIDAGPSANPTIATSGNNVYVVWQDNSLGNGDILYRKSTDGGTTFGPTINLSDSAGFSTNSAVAASGDNVYVVWFDNTPGNPEILYKRSIDGGANFGAPINLSNNVASSLDPAVAASGNNVYVVWYDNTPGNFEILYKRSTDGGVSFGATINLSNNGAFSGSTSHSDIKK